MRLGVRAKLFIVSLLLVCGAGGVAGTFLEYSLRTWLNQRAEAELWRQARTARDIVEFNPGPSTAQALNALAWRLSDSTGARVTLIDINGNILGDSQLDHRGIRRAENHANRLEVQDALHEGYGFSHRLSSTLHTEMLYAALPFSRGDIRGVIRVSTSMDQVELLVQKLRLTLLLAAIVALSVTMFIGGLSSQYASRALRDLVHHTQRVAQGKAERHTTFQHGDEIGNIAGSFNEIADKLEATVNTLGHERDQFAAILESMSEAVLAVDHRQHVTLINGAGIELLGARSQLCAGAIDESLQHQSLLELIDQVKSGIVACRELTINQRKVLARATPLSFSGGSVIVMHDITNLRRLETIRQDFIANVSHELRTPVSVICANAETLLRGALNDPDHARPFVEALLRNAERLSRIIADLLDISRVEAGKLRLRNLPIALNSAARRATEVLQDDAQRKGIELKINIGEGLVAYGDPQALDQIFLNLLDNALKYSPHGSVVEIDAVPCDAYLCVRVADCGPGLLAEHRHRIFERFYRVDTGRSRDVGGTGLGLSIVKHLCESMGGKVGVDVRQPTGSVFWFTLKMAFHVAAA